MESLFLLVFLALLAVPLVVSARRQRRQMRETQQLQDSLAVGDRVMTTSGLHGTVTSLDESTLELEIAPGVYTTWLTVAIRQRLEDDEDDENEDEDDESDEGERGEWDSDGVSTEQRASAVGEQESSPRSDRS